MRWAEHSAGALQVVGKYNVLDLNDEAFNAAGGCRNTQLYPAVAASSSVTLIAPSVRLCGEMKTRTVGSHRGPGQTRGSTRLVAIVAGQLGQGFGGALLSDTSGH